MKRFLLFLLFVAAGTSRLHSQSGSISPDKMNVFYIGVDNPVTASISGVTSDKYMVSTTGGTISGSRGKYIVRVTSGTECTITLAYNNAAGSLITVGSYRFRVKRVPDPVTYVGSIKGDGTMTKVEAANIRGVFAKMENFDFDLSFSVISFVLVPVTGGKIQTKLKASGPVATADMTTAFKNAAAGDMLIFEEINVKGPDGAIRKIPGVVITIK